MPVSKYESKSTKWAIPDKAHDAKAQRYTTLYVDSEDATTPLSWDNNVLKFKLSKNLQGIQSIRIKNVQILNSLSPFNDSIPFLKFRVFNIATPATTTGVLSLDLATVSSSSVILPQCISLHCYLCP